MNNYTNQIKIKAFVASPHQAETNQYFKQLLGVLRAAKIEVITALEDISKANCAIHLVGNYYEPSPKHFNISDEEYSYNKSCELNKINKEFRIFIWHPSNVAQNESGRKQNKFIQSIRQNLIQNMTFCNHISAIMLVEDIRSIIFEEQKQSHQTKNADVFFIYNEIDEDDGNSIVELLNDIVNVEKLNISLRSNNNYSEFISQQIQQSQLTTIYYNRTSNWALPFTQQVWKNIGGASANKNILMIGDANLAHNNSIAFDAPNVTNICTGTELIPLETKVFYDKLQAQK